MTYKLSTTAIKRLVLISICLAGFLMLQGSKAHAAPVVDRIPPGAMPSDIENYLLSCGNTNNAAAQIGWLSLAGQPTATVTTVNYATPSISLQYNVAVIVCDSSRMGGLKSTNNGIIQTTPSDLGLVGTTLNNPYGATTGSYSVASTVFTYTIPGTFIADTTVSVSLTEKRINIYNVRPLYRCVTNPRETNPRAPNSGTDYGACISQGLPVVSVRVNVVQPTPQVACTVANATIIRGQTYTPSTVVSHSGPGGAPGVSLAGTIIVQGLPADGVSGSLANGGTTTLTGTARTPGAVGTYTVTAALRATSSRPTVDVGCTGTLTVRLPDPVINCSVSNPSITAGDSTGVVVTINHTGPAQAPPAGYTATVSIDTKPNQTFSGSINNGSTTDITTANQQFGAGLFRVHVEITGNARTSCEGTISSLNRPYVRTYNNDVLAGFGFYNQASICQTTTGDINAFARGAAQSYSGSGGQLGVVARGQISGFRSASTLASATGQPQILSFANTVLVNIAGGAYGGNFDSSMCMYNYWQSSINAQTINAQNVNIGALASGSYYIKQTTSAPVSLSGQIANGRHIVLYVEGTALLRGAALGYASATWANLGDIPSLYIVAKGNIAVGSDVRSLDGHFIAQKSNNGDGRITSCTDPATGLPYAAAAAQIANCSNKLVINGSFNADHINFLRTIGSIAQSTPSEPAATSNAAEVFIYPIDSFLSTQSIDSIKQQTYDSITALPPSL